MCTATVEATTMTCNRLTMKLWHPRNYIVAADPKQYSRILLVLCSNDLRSRP